MTKDPVCGMPVDEEHAPGKADYQGKTYYFCARECLQKFVENPSSFVEEPPPSKELEEFPSSS